MTRTFIQTFEFTKNWEQLGLMDDDLLLEIKKIEIKKMIDLLENSL